MACVDDKSNTSNENKISNFLCNYLLKNSEKENIIDENSLTRWYYYLEQEEIQEKIKSNLTFLYNKVSKLFNVINFSVVFEI